jgi:hypothetical protein
MMLKRSLKSVLEYNSLVSSCTVICRFEVGIVKLSGSKHS